VISKTGESDFVLTLIPGRNVIS